MDITVKDWSELIKELYDIPQTKHKRFRSDWVYRGVASKDWGLESSLKRLGPAGPEVEGRRRWGGCEIGPHFQ
jgi:hypothetical protein